MGYLIKIHFKIFISGILQNIYFHFNNSFDRKYIRQKLYENYGDNPKVSIKSKKLSLKKFDNMQISDRGAL